jgi:hypothetical protein
MSQQIKSRATSMYPVAVTFAVGYFLGRGRRTKLAAAVGLAIAAGEGGRMVRRLPLGRIGTILTRRLLRTAVDAAGQAAGQSLNAGAEKLATTLHERSEALQQTMRTTASSPEQDESDTRPGAEASGAERGEEPGGAGVRSEDERSQPQVRSRPLGRQVER